MIRSSSDVGRRRVERDEFRRIFYQSLHKLAFERELESIEEALKEVVAQQYDLDERPGESSSFDEPQYESSIAWLEARARLKNAAATTDSVAAPMAIAKVSASDEEWADEVEEVTVGAFKKSAPRAPRTINYEP